MKFLYKITNIISKSDIFLWGAIALLIIEIVWLDKII